VRVVAAALAVLAVAAPPRAGLQRTLHAVVTGLDRAAPGAVAYVSGPEGTWTGSAGYANLATKARMSANARMRLGSVSKLWTATVVVELATEHELALDDTVERWLPGLFPDGARMTIRQLLNHTSGLIDNNDLMASPQRWLERIADPALHDEWERALASLKRDPAAEVPDLLQVRVAAALPLLTTPGTNYHYSNIGYKVAGMIAEEASGGRSRSCTTASSSGRSD
jgi:D-alanyl-D-alanine carboxypeptidase